MTAVDDFTKLIQKDIQEAMKNGQELEVSAMKTLLARINNAEAVDPTESDKTEVPRKVLTPGEIADIIQAEFDEIDATLANLEETSQYAAELKAKAATIERYRT